MMMQIPKLIAASFLLINSCVLLCAQQPAATPKRADEPKTTGAIDGRVVNESGQSMAGATVYVRAINSGGTGRTTNSDIEGNFRVSGLEPALYTVSAVAPAYITASSADIFNPTYHRIGDTVRIEMVRGGAITGTVTNALGEPIVAIRVRATMVRDARGEPPKMIVGSAEQPTDDRGVYRIYGLRPGSYIISAGGAGFAYQFNPFDQDVPTYAPSASRDTAAEVLVRSGEDSTIDIRYRGEPGHLISGTVKLAGTNGAAVALTQSGSSVQVGNTYQPPGRQGFSFTGLGDGDYDVVAQELSSDPNNTTTPVFSVSEPKRISVKGADVTGIELSTKPLSSISGKIALEPTKAPECQGKRPPLFAEMVVRLQKPEKETEKEEPLTLRFLTFASAASPDANGAFLLRNLASGKYQFEPRFYARYWYLQSITTTTGTPKPQKFDAAANWMTVKSGEQLSNFTITIAQGAASIRGRVVVPEGSPVSAMSLYLVPAEPDKANDVLRYFMSDVAGDMTFTFNNLPPGRYLTHLDTQTTTLKKLRLPEAAPERLKVRRSAETKKNEIELKPCQNLTDYQLKP